MRLFHPLHLDGLCGAVYNMFLQVDCYCPPKNTVLTHRLLALRRGRDTAYAVPPHRSGRADFRIRLLPQVVTRRRREG